MSATKIVTDEDLAELYQRLLPYLNGDAMSYSTSEQDTGKRWIDGKPLYQKTVNCGTLPNNTSKTFTHSIANIRNIINVSGVFINGTTSGALPQASTSSGSVVGMYADGTKIYLDTASDLSAFTAYVTLQYTKTT